MHIHWEFINVIEFTMHLFNANEIFVILKLWVIGQMNQDCRSYKQNLMKTSYIVDIIVSTSLSPPLHITLWT